MGKDPDLVFWFEFSTLAKMIADSARIAILASFHEVRLSLNSASESEILDMEVNEPAKPSRNLGKAWSFDREWECTLFDDARTSADFVVEHDIKNRMQTEPWIRLIHDNILIMILLCLELCLARFRIGVPVL